MREQERPYGDREKREVTVEGARAKARAEIDARLEEATQVRASIGESAWQGLRRLIIAETTLTGAYSILFLAVGVIACTVGVQWAVVRFFHRVIGAGTWLDRGPFYLAVALGLFGVVVAVWYFVNSRMVAALDDIAARGMDRDLLWRAVTAKWAARDLEERAVENIEEGIDASRFEQETLGVRPWWLVELSGAHVLWWLSFILGIGYLIWYWELPDWLLSIVGPVAVGGAIMKWFLPAMWLAKSVRGRDRRNLARYYRWWGRGWLPVALALLPAAAAWAAKAIP